MKIGADRNPKFVQFMELLRVSRPMAVGLLELLWHATAEFAPQGDIGRFDDRGIAKLIGWRGSPDRLVSALTEGRWLDEDPVHRLLVHDWPDHAPAYVKKRLERADMPYFWPAADNGRQDPPSCLPTKPYQALTKPSLNQAQPNPTKEQTLPAKAGGFDLFWKAYPRKVGKKVARKAWKKATDRPDTKTLLAALEAQKASDQWQKDGGQFVPHPATWLNQGRWDDEPEGAGHGRKGKAPTGPSTYRPPEKLPG